MTSPTDLPGATDATAPGDAITPVDAVMAACIATATHALRERGEFYPFALAMHRDGEFLAPQVEPGEHPAPDEVMALLVAALRTAAQDLVATAVVADVLLGPDSPESAGRDAVRIDLEAPGEAPVTVLVPYTGGPGELTVLEPFAVAAEPRVWA